MPRNPKTTNRFEELLKAAQVSPKKWRDAVVLVADSAFMCRAWLEDHVPGWAPADLIAMTRMVVDKLPPVTGEFDGD